jgi:hypothetical protein
VATLPRKPAKLNTKKEAPRYVCQCCGEEKSDINFFTAKWSKVWNITNHKVLFCKDCIQKLFDEFKNRFDEFTALKICCHYLDVPVSREMYDSIVQNNNFFNVGLYLRQMNLRQLQYQGFEVSMVNGELSKTEDIAKEEREAKWSRADKQNMNYCISVCGYDPFENCGMTDLDRKYCFNILAGYCDSQGVSEDGHKVQSVIQITQSQLQCRKLDEFINAELMSQSPDESRIKNLSTTKKQLLDAIAKIAQDNNISSAYNQNSKKGMNTLSSKMKEIADNGFESIYVNCFDIETCKAMEQIAEISNQAIMNELCLDSSDYSDMVKEQRGMITELDKKAKSLEEENRILKNRIMDLEAKKK